MEESRPTAQDETLLAASATGDRGAFASFYRRHLAAVLGFLLRETGDRELAADLAAEVFATALLAAGRYRPQPARARARRWGGGPAGERAGESRGRGRAGARARRRLGIPRELPQDEDLVR